MSIRPPDSYFLGHTFPSGDSRYEVLRTNRDMHDQGGGFWKFYGSVRMRMRGDMGTLIQLLTLHSSLAQGGVSLRGVCFRSGVSFYFTQYSRYDLSHVDKSGNYTHLFRGYIEEEKKNHHYLITRLVKGRVEGPKFPDV